MNPDSHGWQIARALPGSIVDGTTRTMNPSGPEDFSRPEDGEHATR